MNENEKDGIGKLVCTDGKVYEGTWLKGQLHGEGKLIHPDGKEEPCVWEKGYPKRDEVKAAALQDEEHKSDNQSPQFKQPLHQESYPESNEKNIS